MVDSRLKRTVTKTLAFWRRLNRCQLVGQNKAFAMDSRHSNQSHSSVAVSIFSLAVATAKLMCSTNCLKTKIRPIEISPFHFKTIGMVGTAFL
jgi:hypothetical protein